MSRYEEEVKESGIYISHLLEDVKDILDSNKIKYYESDASTIVIENADKKEISSLIKTLPLPEVVLYIALDVCQVKNKVYVRKKIKG